VTAARKQIVVLGLITRMPVAGAIWQTLHYLLGLRRLGYDVYYVEAHGITPVHFMEGPEDDGPARAAAFLDRLLRAFDLGDRWAYHAVNDRGRQFGMSERRLKRLYRSAELLINLHGGTMPLPEHVETGRLVCLETDPVELEVELHDGYWRAVEFAAAHRSSFATWALNYGNPDCKVPLPEGIDFLPAPPCVLLDLWAHDGAQTGDAFTTVANWRQQLHTVTFEGEVYTWSKHTEFLKFLDLPSRTGQPFELALSSVAEEELALLQQNGWRLRAANEISDDLDAYRRYICTSRGEFTVAKDQNVRLRSGWFSERSAAYLAAGRPVIMQDTGFGNFLPTGEGLFAFSTMDEILAAVDAVNSDWDRHARAAREIAREFLDADLVLPRVLDHMGVTSPVRARHR
jgi:hypothetical protein